MQHGYIILMKLQERNKKGRSIMKVNVKLLEEEMDKKHVSVSELARMSNVDKSTISRLLNEQRACSIATAQAVVQALDIPSKKAGLIFLVQKLHKCNFKESYQRLPQKGEHIMENKNFCESLDPIERESFLEKLNDCNDIEYLKQVIEVCRSKVIYLALKKEGLI